jgi:hypothetical protein
MLMGMLAAAPAAAQSADSRSARVLFREGRKLMDGGHFEEACPKLEESLRLDDGMGTRFNLAHCYEHIGRTASAWGLFLDVASAAKAGGQPKRELAARKRAEALEPKLTRLLVEVADPAPEMVVRLGGEELRRGAWGTAMPVDPGSELVEASAPGRRPWRRAVLANAPGETVKISIPVLEEEKQAPAPAPVEAAAEPRSAAPAAMPEESTSAGVGSGRITASVVLAVVGAAGIATGTIFGLRAQSETDKARKLCVGGPDRLSCDRGQGTPGFDGGVAELRELQDHRTKRDHAALISYVGFGVGGASLAASVIVLLTAPSENASSDTLGMKLEPLLGKGVLGTGLSGHF